MTHASIPAAGRAPARVVLAACLLAFLALAPSASAEFHVESITGGAFNRDGSSATQAGSHPYRATTDIRFPTRGPGMTDGSVKDVEVDLPPGLVGNPSITPAKCTSEQLAEGFVGDCPVSSQVGIATLYVPVEIISGEWSPVAVYNMEAPAGSPAVFGFHIAGQPAYLIPRVRTGGDYGLTVSSPDVSQLIPVRGVSVTLWGDPADPSHDSERGTVGGSTGNYCAAAGCSRPAGYPSRAFLTLPSNCSAGVLTTVVRASSWQDPGVFYTAFFDHDTNGNAMAVTGCESVPFDPDISVRPTSRQPDSPTGLEVELTMPTDGLINSAGLAQANLKRVRVTLPEGMTVNPSSASGLGACTASQLGLNSAAAASCPESAKIGTISIETPLLDNALQGGVYVRSQNSGDPASGEMFRIAIVVDDAQTGIRVKLGGSVVADPVSGRLTTMFDGNPQVPFSRLSLHLKDGPRAPLATPATCGEKSVTTEMSSWSVVSPSNPTADDIVTKTSRFTIDCTPGLGGFSPSFAAGTLTPVAGEFSPFALRINRSDRQRYIDGLSMRMPTGLVAKLAGVVRCPDASADAGACPESSRVGTATVGAGVGANPFFLKGGVYLTGPYKGAPFGLAVKVRAKAGPFDLGDVIVRQRLLVDPVDARVTVVSDPLPTIVKGVPVRLRSLNVDVDRPNFTLNPTSCARKAVTAQIATVGGPAFDASARFGVTNCAALGFKPKLGMRLAGKRQTRTGGHPALSAVLTQGSGQANVRSAKVVLPKSVALDPNNSTDPKLVCGYDEGLKADCPASSVIGKATASTPLLDKALTGDVHLVQGIRFGPSGNRIRTLPTLLVKLRGEVAIDVRAKTSTKNGRLVTTFPATPDARVSRFAVKVNGGRKGILVVTRTAKANIDLCRGRQIANVQTDGHNAKRADFATQVKTPCARTAARKSKSRR